MILISITFAYLTTIAFLVLTDATKEDFFIFFICSATILGLFLLFLAGFTGFLELSKHITILWK